MNEVFVIGGGPSCKNLDFSLLAGKETIGCNDAAIHSNSKYLFSLDRTWINRREETWRSYGDRAHLGLTPIADMGEAVIYDRIRDAKFSLQDKVITGTNSGHGAFNLAVKWKPDIIHLLGFDFVDLGHWHDGYNWGKQLNRWMLNWAEAIDQNAQMIKGLGIHVINWNLNSGLQNYEKRDIDDLPDYVRLSERP
jgi:hypothetical protein